MARMKVQLAYIADDSARKATYKKRKKGLLKKVSEISTLCGVEACAIVCSPYELKPVVWPDHERAQKVVEDFRDLPDMDRHQRMFDHPAYLWQRICKSNQQLGRLLSDNRKKSVALAMYGCLAGEMRLDDLTSFDLNDLSQMIDRSLAEIGRHMEALGQGSTDPMPPPQLPIPNVGLSMLAPSAPQQPIPNVGLSMPAPLAPQQLIPNAGLSMLAPPAQLPAVGSGTPGLGLGGLTGMPMWQLHWAAEAGGSSGAGSSSVPPVFGGKPK